MKKQNITIHGSTGTIGKNALSVIAKSSNQYKVFALSAKSKIKTLYNQIKKFTPKYAVVLSKEKARNLSYLCANNNISTKILFGTDSYKRISSDRRVDCVLSGISGTSALHPTYAAIKSGKKLLLANKESLIMSGELMLKASQKSGSEIIPVDSEHNALFQILSPLFKSSKINLRKSDEIAKIILTASGGPFLNFKKNELKNVTPNQATKHPNWIMGKKISVDSATMMNKGLELIEACYLFDIHHNNIDVVIHPESIIHSCVEYMDGSMLAQMGTPDMRTPISFTLAYPERIKTNVQKLNLSEIKKLTFFEPDLNKYPCLQLAYNSLEIGKSAPTILNAANEVAVQRFLEKKIKFLSIAKVVEKTLKNSSICSINSIKDVIEIDKESRDLTNNIIKSGSF